MRRKILISLAIVALIVASSVGGLLIGRSLASSGGASPVPSVIQYQGTLTDPGTGLPVADCDYTFVFSIYDTETGGSPLWQETQTVTLVNGLFSVMLGSNVALSASVFEGSPRYLGIKVGSDAEMAERQLLASVPYAFHAAEAGHSLSSDSAKQQIRDFVVASGESVTAGNVVGYINGYVQKTRSGISAEQVFNPAQTLDISVAALSRTKFVLVYQDVGNSQYGTAVIGDISGDTVTYGLEQVFNPAQTLQISVVALSENKFAVAYDDVGNSGYGTAVIGDISGSTITWGPEQVFNLAFTGAISAATLSPTRLLVAYSDGGNSYYGTAVIGDVSGNTITWGPEQVFLSLNTSYGCIVTSLS